jgi:hypothetical protein
MCGWGKGGVSTGNTTQCIYREKISRTDLVKNDEVPQRVKDEWNFAPRIKRRIRHMLRRNCHIKHVIEGKIEQTERRGR